MGRLIWVNFDEGPNFYVHKREKQLNDRKQYMKEYYHNRWANDPQYRNASLARRRDYDRRFKEQNGIPYNTARWRQLKQEVARLREERNEH